MKRIFILCIFLLAASMIAACGSNSAAPAASSDTTGVKVQTGGGSYTNVTPQELKTMLNAKDFVFVNTHIPYEGEIEPTDAFVPYNALDENLGKLPADKNAKIVLYCRSDRMSTIAANELVKKGYTNLYNLVGGMVAWENAGYPLSVKK
ncbi:MAG: rhodanese-like domain-containing protein [Chloroflexi bacterium]|nr:rhodanese-like domain-containing protein [Chloroflexota bacterium]